MNFTIHFDIYLKDDLVAYGSEGQLLNKVQDTEFFHEECDLYHIGTVYEIRSDL